MTKSSAVGTALFEGVRQRSGHYGSPSQLRAAGAAGLLVVVLLAFTRGATAALAALGALAAAPVLIFVCRVALARPEWTLFAIVLEETLPYVSLHPAQAQTADPRWIIRYPLLILIALPLIPRAFRSRLLVQKSFRLFLVYYAWCAITVSYSLLPLVSAGRLIPNVLLFVCLAGVASTVEERNDVRRLFERFYLGCVILVGLTVLGAVLLPHDVSWARDTTGLERFQGLFGDPNAIGQLMMVTVAVGTYLWRGVGKRVRLAIAVTSIISILLAALADSRSAFVAIAIGEAAYLTWKYGAKGIAASVLVLAIAVGGYGSLGSTGREYVTRHLTTLTGRTEAWHFETQMLWQRPILGYGYDIEGEIFRNRYFTNWDAFWDRGPNVPLHNGYLSIAIGIGLPALVFWVFLFCSPWRRLFRRERDAWDLKPLFFLVCLPALARGFDESWLDGVRYPIGVLVTLCWVLAARSGMMGQGAGSATEPVVAPRGRRLARALFGVLVGAMLLVGPANLYAATYYVDATSGSDANSGLSPAAAWRTVAKVNATRFEAGDSLLFRRDRVWREMLRPLNGGSERRPVTFGAYGKGSRPVFNGSDLVQGWQRLPGGIFVAPFKNHAANVFASGLPPWGLRRSTCSKTKQSWGMPFGREETVQLGPESWCQKSGKLFVRLSRDGDPRHERMEAAVRVAGFYVNVADSRDSYIVVENLAVEKTAGYGIYFHSYRGRTGLRGVVIRNNRVTQTGTGPVDYGNYYNAIMILQEPELHIAPVISGNQISYSGGHGNAINSQGADGAIIENNEVSHWNHNGIDIKNSRNVAVTGNYAHDEKRGGAGFYCEYSRGIVWQHNRVVGVANGFQVSVGCSATLRSDEIDDAGVGVVIEPRAEAANMAGLRIRRSPFAATTDGRARLEEEDNDWGPAPRFRFGKSFVGLTQWVNLIRSGPAGDGA